MEAQRAERNRSLPSKEVLAQLLNLKWSYVQIGDEYGVTKQAVYGALVGHGLVVAKDYSDWIPWRGMRDPQDPLVRILRRLARHESGLPLSGNPKLHDRFLRKLERDLAALDREDKDFPHGSVVVQSDGNPEFILVPRTAEEKAEGRYSRA